MNKISLGSALLMSRAYNRAQSRIRVKDDRQRYHQGLTENHTEILYKIELKAKVNADVFASKIRSDISTSRLKSTYTIGSILVADCKIEVDFDLVTGVADDIEQQYGREIVKHYQHVFTATLGEYFDDFYVESFKHVDSHQRIFYQFYINENPTKKI